MGPLSCTTRLRRLRSQASRASFTAHPCSTSAPGPARYVARSALWARSRSRWTRPWTCSARWATAAVLAIAGDMCALPFADCCFDAAVSGFAISHIDAPEDALVEMRRVVRGHGRVIASVFGEAEGRVSKDVVDEVARQFGYEPPDWYVQLKTRTEPKSNTPALLRRCAEAAGLEDIDVADLTVDSGLATPEAIVAYRTGLAHLAPFVDSLSASRRAALHRLRRGRSPRTRSSRLAASSWSSRVAFRHNEERPLAVAPRVEPRVCPDGSAHA